MKKTFGFSIVGAVACLSMQCGGVARAGDEGWSAFGGFVGGMVVNEVFYHRHEPARCGGSSRVVYGGGGVSHGGRYYGQPPAARTEIGHYEIRETKTWVPPRTTETRLACGKIERRTEPGYWQVDREQVWVPESRHGGRR